MHMHDSQLNKGEHSTVKSIPEIWMTQLLTQRITVSGCTKHNMQIGLIVYSSLQT